MHWIKKGLIYSPKNESSWHHNSALQPTPFSLNEETIRLFCGFRDNKGVSRIGYVDVLADNPAIILKVSPQPVLDIGLPGTFDDNGVVPCAIVKKEKEIFLYYAGYQIMEKVRFQVFSGLAISQDEGETFTRYQNTPILERTHDEFLFRVIHTLFWSEGVWKVWYGAGSHFIQGKNKSLPVYNIRYMESTDGIHFPKVGELAIDIENDEFRVGRPFVIQNEASYQMYFAAATQRSPYRLAYAESDDGRNWQRKDDKIRLHYESTDFDSEMSSYPAVVGHKNKQYLFYNGNNYGYAGFGYAESLAESLSAAC